MHILAMTVPSARALWVSRSARMICKKGPSQGKAVVPMGTVADIAMLYDDSHGPPKVGSVRVGHPAGVSAGPGWSE